jgi:hypothetical protein
MRLSARWLLGVSASVVWFGATASVALAAGGYGAVAGEQTGGGNTGSLPFTGMNLVAYAVIAAAIMAAGFALRRLAGRDGRVE